MISRKIESTGHFTIVITAGSLMIFFFGYIYRIIALLLLSNTDYGFFAIIIRTYGIILPISSFALHIPLTREIKKVNDDSEMRYIFQNFLFSYFLTSLFSIILFIIIGLSFFNFIGIFLVILLAISLVFFSFSEFYMGLSNGYTMPIKGQIIQVMSSLITAILAIVSIFFKSLQSLEFFLFYSGIGYFGSFLIGVFLYKKEMSKYLSKMDLIEKKKVGENIKNSSFMLSTGFVKNFSYWIITIFAVSLLDNFAFKIFDLSLMIVQVIGMVAYSLTIALLSKKNIETLNTKSFMKKSIIPILILNIIIEIIFFTFNLDLILLNILFGEIPFESQLFIRVSLFITIPYLVSSFYGGKILNKGKYSSYLISSIFGLIISVIFYILALLFHLQNILLLGLIFEKIIYSILLIIFDNR